MTTVNLQGLNNFWSQNRSNLLFLLAIGCALFFYELSNFNLTIDEEIAIRSQTANLEWLKQGRWGMYLLNHLFLPSPIVPFVPLFVAIFFSCLAFIIIAQSLGAEDDLAFYIAGTIFVGCPTLFYVYQFNTLNYAIGLGFFLLALGVNLQLKGGLQNWVLSLIAFTICISIYQSFVLLIAVLFLALILSKAMAESAEVFDIPVKTFLVFGSALALSVILSLAVGRLILGVLDQSASAYTRIFFDPMGSFQAWEQTLRKTAAAFKDVYLGSDAIYGSTLWSLGLLFLLSLALLVKQVFALRWPVTHKLLALCMVFLILALPFSLHLTNRGMMPFRSLVTVPFVFSFLAFVALRTTGPKTRYLLAAIGVVAALNMAVANSRFSLQDQMARESDRLLALRIQTRIDLLGLSEQPWPIPLEVVGTPKERSSPYMKTRETIAGSFFTHDQGNIYRIVLFLESLGLEHFRAATVNERRTIMPQVKLMPIWPEAGSVGLIDGVVVVKLADYSYAQRSRLCESSDVC